MSLDRIDSTFRKPVLLQPTQGAWSHARKPLWGTMMTKWITKILTTGGRVLDIGGGLRIKNGKGDQVDLKRQKEYLHLLQNPSLTYQVSDYTDQYHPDFVEDIHALSFADNTFDGLICLAVLEHVYDPKRAAEEIVRVIKPGGTALIYVPFIYRYHAHKNDYRDYFRYSKDGLAYLFRDCQSITLCPVRGLFESLLRFTPLHHVALLRGVFRLLDWSGTRMRSISTKQTSGYYVLLKK